jgi:hypothetical protein
MSQIYNLLVFPRKGVTVATHDGARYLTDRGILTSHPVVTDWFKGLDDGLYEVKPKSIRRHNGPLTPWREIERLLTRFRSADDWELGDDLGIAIVGMEANDRIPDTLIFGTIPNPGSLRHLFAIRRDVHDAWARVTWPAFRVYYSPSRNVIRIGDEDVGIAAYVQPWKHSALEERMREVRDSLDSLLSGVAA